MFLNGFSFSIAIREILRHNLHLLILRRCPVFDLPRLPDLVHNERHVRLVINILQLRLELSNIDRAFARGIPGVVEKVGTRPRCLLPLGRLQLLDALVRLLMILLGKLALNALLLHDLIELRFLARLEVSAGPWDRPRFYRCHRRLVKPSG